MSKSKISLTIKNAGEPKRILLTDWYGSELVFELFDSDSSDENFSEIVNLTKNEVEELIVEITKIKDTLK